MSKITKSSSLYFFLLILFSLLVLTGCSPKQLIVQTRYFSHEDLASFYVDTPDPLQNDPPVGQSLLIFWRLGKDFQKYNKVKISYKIRFKNRKEIEKSLVVNKSRGYFIYSLYNQEYFDTGGISTYKVELLGDGERIEEWRQQLWKELIQL